MGFLAPGLHPSDRLAHRADNAIWARTSKCMFQLFSIVVCVPQAHHNAVHLDMGMYLLADRLNLRECERRQSRDNEHCRRLARESRENFFRNRFGRKQQRGMPSLFQKLSFDSPGCKRAPTAPSSMPATACG